MMLLRANDDIISRDYLLLAMQAPFVRAYAEHVSVGSGVLHMRVGDVEQLPIPVPPRSDQSDIVRRVDALFALADAIEKRVAAATARADKLPQAVLSKAFRGELVPTEAELARAEGRTYETAEELLARVKAEREKSGGEGAKANRGAAAGAKRGRPRKDKLTKG